MNSFDIIGPVMVGPSSSHTAGAVKIGNVAHRLLGCPVGRAEIYLHGSFLSTGKGHGTDKALVAGLLGFGVDDPRIAESFRLADEAGMAYRLSGIDLGDVHPNSVLLALTGTDGHTLRMTAASVGGGSILVTQIDGLDVSFSGDSPTLIISNQDRPGQVNQVASLLGLKSINVADMQLHRAQKGGCAIMVLECDQEVPTDVTDRLALLDGIRKVTYLGRL